MSFTHRVRSNTFIRHNTTYFVGSLLIGILNYLYYPVLGRIMEPAAFGEVQALVSFFLQIGIFLTVLGLLSINIIANSDDSRQRDRIIVELEKLALFISLVLLGATLLLGPMLRDYFQFGSAWPFSMLALAVVVTVPFTFRSAYLRGKQRFGQNSLAFIIGAGSKLVISATLVLIGLRTVGAIAGIVLAQLLAFVYAAHYARKYGFTEHLRNKLFKKPDLQVLRPELKYALLVLAGSLSITIMYSVDIVIVKHYFDAHTAGLYAGIATVARIVFFLTASIAQVLMPSVRIHRPITENRDTLLKSLVLLIAISGAALIVFWTAPRFIVGTLMGQEYVAFAGLLPRLASAVFIISVLNLFMVYSIALRRYVSGIIIVSGAAITVVWVQLSHQSLQAVVDSLFYGSLTLLMPFVVWTAWNNRKFVTERSTV